jgi:uncharacterized protein GlcG (DUF336 family)
MKSDTGRRIMDAARAKAKEIGKGVSIIVVDAGGTPVCMERVNDASPATTFIAEGKAVASVMMGRDSGAMEKLLERFPPISKVYDNISAKVNGRFLVLQGAVVILDDGAVVGAVGTSGATSEEDEAISRAGADQYAAG